MGDNAGRSINSQYSSFLMPRIIDGQFADGGEVGAASGGSRELFAHYLRAIRRRRHDAVIVAETLLLEPAAWRQLVATGIPVVLIGGMPRPQADRVYIDDYAAARDVMDYLIRKGHTLIDHHWGVPATWEANYSSVAMSADRGATWTVETRKVKWGPDSNFAQVAVAPDPGGRYLLFYGIPAGRFGAVKLMRTRNTWQGVLTAHDYEYYTGRDGAGRPHWSRSPARAVTIADAPVGELSVIYDPGLKHWLMTYLQGGNDAVMPSSDNLVIRSAPDYWGPWSQPATLATHQRYPGLYGAFMNPRFLADSGHTLYFVMSQWGPYSVFWMRASLGEKRYSGLNRSILAMRRGKEEHTHGTE